MKTRLLVALLGVVSAAGCAHRPVYRPPAASVWLSFGPLQEDVDWLRRREMFLRDDGTYATVSRHGAGDVIQVREDVGAIPDSALRRMRAIADLPEVQAYRGCGAVDGADRLYEFQIRRESFTQRILFTYACQHTFPDGVGKLFLAFHRSLAGAPPF